MSGNRNPALVKATKGYHSQEKLINNYDLDPQLVMSAVSPLSINLAVRSGNYKTSNKEELKDKLRKAVHFATEAANIHAANIHADNDSAHQLRINTYTALITYLG
eukprot:GFUD01032822.1.p1 GENE.GFUD01032822.1~~GFUD01032822.1.p1  ORF type:complete len:105 (-),score=27.95 GFUD01032822.1:65-379(-)